ncbi:MAG: exosortase/archaeosortase family protein [Candidatus Omnitrophica bacterium]|nr:exosortase/archaeosortase family protein [Candidatus Omnitrophota bacterium]
MAAKTFKKIDKIKTGIITLLVLVLFYPTYYHLYGRFTSADSYYSHGVLVPFITLFLVWRRRKEIFNSTVKSSPMGLVVLIFGLLLYLASQQLQINFGSYLSIIFVISGLVLYLLGAEFFRKLLFPIGFLLFMMPLPRVMIIGISFKMKIMAAQLSTLVVNLMGLEAVREGSTIFFGNESLIVGDPCSGLRSLISFFALGALFIQFVDAKWFKKFILVLSTFPVAVISNMVRLVLLVLATHVYGQEFALGFFHDLTGVLVFVVGFFGLYFVSKVLGCEF